MDKSCPIAEWSVIQMPFHYWTKFCPVFGTQFEYPTGIQMVVCIPNYHLNTGQVTYHYGKPSAAQPYNRKTPRFTMSQFFDLHCQLISCWSVYIRSNLPLLDICEGNSQMVNCYCCELIMTHDVISNIVNIQHYVIVRWSIIFTSSVQWGSEIWPYKIWEHLKSGLFEGLISNGPVF